MGTPRKASVRRSGRAGTELTAGMLKVLITGQPLEFNDPASDPGCEFWAVLPEFDSAMRAVWQIAGDGITQAYITENPGKRPAGWWVFEDPSGLFRRKVGGDCEVHIRPTAPGFTRDPWPHITVNPLFESNAFGIPRIYDINPRLPLVFESQAQFLKRNKLLTATEKAVLQPNEYRPQVIVAASET